VKSICGLLAMGIIVGIVPANAETANIPFSANVPGTCTITAMSTGELRVDGTFQNLNSLAVPSTARVVATSDDFAVSMNTPTLVRPVTDTTPLNSLGGAYHPITYSGDNGHLINQFDTDGPQSINRGTIDLNLFFFAGKTGTNIFTAGNYTADVMLRCE